jgi:hypothetical protein
VIDNNNGSWEGTRARVAYRRQGELDIAILMVRVLEEIPKALEHCRDFEMDSAEVFTTWFPSFYSKYDTAVMSHWPITGVVAVKRVGFLRQQRPLGFWLREDGEIAVSMGSVEYLRIAKYPVTRAYDLKMLDTFQLPRLLRGIQTI